MDKLPNCYRCDRQASNILEDGICWCSWCGQSFDPRDKDAYLREKKRKERENLSAKLLDSVQFDDLEEVQKLINAGADVNMMNEHGATPLKFAAGAGRVRVAELLIDHGAGPLTIDMAASLGWTNEVVHLLDEGEDINQSDKAGMTPLHHALWQGQTEVAKLLIERGADVKLMDDGKPCLHFAAEKGYAVVVELLLQKGLDVNARDSAQRTPLHVAVVGPIGFANALTREASLRGQIPSIKLLLKSGADINAQDQEGETALDKAVELNQEEIISLLLKNGAQSSIRESDEFIHQDSREHTSKKWWQFWK